MPTTNDVITACERAADAADAVGKTEQASLLRDMAADLRGLKPLLGD